MQAPDTDEKQVKLTDYLRVLYRGRWIIIISFLAVVGSTAFFSFTAQPTYEASVLVMIDQERGMERTLFEVPPFSRQTTMIRNQEEILKSRHLAELVVRRLLALGMRDSLHLFRFEDKREGRSLIYSAVRRLQDNISVNPIRDTDMIKIKVKAPSSYEAAFLANTVVEVYQDYDRESSRGEVSEVVKFLEEQLRKKEKDLKESEEALRRFQEKERVVSLSEETKEMVAQLVEFESMYNEAKTDLMAYQKRLEYLKNQLGERKERLEKDLAQISTPLIQELRRKLAESEAKIAVYKAEGISPDYPEYKKELEKVTSLKKRLTDQISKLLLTGITPDNPLAPAQELLERIVEVEAEVQSYKAKTDALKKIVEQYSRKLKTLPDKSLELARLERAKRVDENLYIMMKEKYEEARITRAGQIGKIRIVDKAVPPEHPVSPKKKLNLILAALVGLGLGVGVTFLLEYMDNSVRTVEDVENLGMALLGSIPAIKLEETDGVFKTRRKRVRDREATTIASRLVTHLKPKSPISEAYRTLRTNIQYSATDGPLKTILVTSSGPKEGKSTTVANLAIIMAQMGSKALLVDTDLRRPVLHAIFRKDKSKGLTNLLVEKATLDEVIKPTEVENLSLITCGTLPPNPSELLGSKRMKEVVEELKKRFDIVLFDSPPVIAVTDAAVLASILDGVVLVIRSGQTDREAVIRANSLLRNVRARVLGTLLNDVNVTSMYGSYYYYYYYHYYYGREGGERKKIRIKRKRRA